MPEHVVYLLGAGFSAPLGLPVMANFVSKSKDQFSTASGKYKHFSDVFVLFEKLAKVKSFYHSDLSNIEEVLSILAIGDFSEGVDKTRFIKYLADVVSYYTPKLTQYAGGSLPNNWRLYTFGGSRVHNDYGNFILALARRSLNYTGSPGGFSTHPPDQSIPTYAVVTLNYDSVIENLHNYCKDHLSLAVPLNLNTPWASFHLKTIDVICLDPDEGVKRRYDSFIDHPGYRFKNASVADYFNNITARADANPGGNVASFLEQTHAYFTER